jgi:DNA-binding transcriptional LysR family regulator
METSVLKLFCEIVESCPIYVNGHAFPVKALVQAMTPLEEFLGKKALVLEDNKLDATEAGRAFYPFAKEMMKSMEEGWKAVSVAKEGRSVLVLGTCTGSGNSFMVSVLGQYRKAAPDTKVVLRLDNSAAIAEKVKAGIFELGIVGYQFGDTALHYEEILQDELVVIVPTDHTLAQNEAVGLEELRSQPFILEQEGSGSRESLFEELEKNGIRAADLNIAMEVGLHESVKSAVISGLGISILPWLSVVKDANLKRLAALPVADCRLTRKFYLVNRSENPLSSTAESFYEFLKERISDYHG